MTTICDEAPYMGLEKLLSFLTAFVLHSPCEGAEITLQRQWTAKMPATCQLVS